MDVACKHCGSFHPDTSEHWRYLPKGRMCRIYHREYNAQWIANNREKHRHYSKKVRDSKPKSERIILGKEGRLRKYAEQHKLKMKQDPSYRMLINLRKRLKKALKAQSTKKTNRFVEILGCTNEELKVHLELKFSSGMTWDNYGKWHIDHILPLSKFNLTDPEQVKIAGHYTNLQPLWAADNIRKKDKVLVPIGYKTGADSGSRR